MVSALEKLKMHRMVEDVSVESDVVMVALRPGFTNDALGGCPISFGEDTPARALKYLRDNVMVCDSPLCCRKACARD